jgi:hypothetical protein
MLREISNFLVVRDPLFEGWLAQLLANREMASAHPHVPLHCAEELWYCSPVQSVRLGCSRVSLLIQVSQAPSVSSPAE